MTRKATMTDTTLDRGTTQRSGDAMSDEPTALELADYLQRGIYTHFVRDRRRLDEAADMLRRQHGENEALRADNERLRQVIADLAPIPEEMGKCIRACELVAGHVGQSRWTWQARKDLKATVKRLAAVIETGGAS